MPRRDAGVEFDAAEPPAFQGDGPDCRRQPALHLRVASHQRGRVLVPPQLPAQLAVASPPHRVALTAVTPPPAAASRSRSRRAAPPARPQPLAGGAPATGGAADAPSRSRALPTSAPACAGPPARRSSAAAAAAPQRHHLHGAPRRAARRSRRLRRRRRRRRGGRLVAAVLLLADRLAAGVDGDPLPPEGRLAQGVAQRRRGAASCRALSGARRSTMCLRAVAGSYLPAALPPE